MGHFWGPEIFFLSGPESALGGPMHKELYCKVLQLEWDVVAVYPWDFFLWH